MGVLDKHKLNITKQYNYPLKKKNPFELLKPSLPLKRHEINNNSWFVYSPVDICMMPHYCE